jgi:lactate dehydrogenase-like 2-hydroxyacid dehydrogenase
VSGPSTDPVVLCGAGVQDIVRQAVAERYGTIGPLRAPLSESILRLRAGEASAVRILVTLGGSSTSRAAMEALPNLGLISCTGAGYDGVDLAAAGELGIRVSNSPGVTASSVADVAMGLLIASVRGFFEANGKLRAGGLVRPWPAGPGLTGRRAGVYGLGAIGEKVAARARALEMEVGYYSRTQRPDLPYRSFDSLAALASWCDYLLVCVPAGPETAGSVDAAVLQALGREGHLINVARGSIVDTRALCRALSDRAVAGAGLDVFDPAYLPELLGLPNAVITPHIGGSTNEAAAMMRDLVLANIESWLNGREPVTPVL